jgi:hypothetical protein
MIFNFNNQRWSGLLSLLWLLAAATEARAEVPTSTTGPEIELPGPARGEPPPPSSEPSATTIGGYGEITLNIPIDTAASAVVDLRRFVLFVGHNFTEVIRLYSELEVEHAVSSASDQGEFEVEQAYLEAAFSRRFNLRGGLVIMPVGIINQFHEPPSFFGVDRPLVDTLVIPSTWREPGVGIWGELTDAVHYQLYFVNGLNANGFTAQGVAGGHQEAQLAYAGDFGGVGRIAYQPVVGSELGLSAYFATSGNSLRSTVGRVPVGLIEADARYLEHGLSLRAEIALLSIGQADRLDAVLAQGPSAMAGPVASALFGGYVEAGYDLFVAFGAPDPDQALFVFARYDHADTQAGVPVGFTPRLEDRRMSATLGLSYKPIPQIALKLDARRHFFGAGPPYTEVASAITWMF